MKKDKENELFGDVRHLYKNFDAVRVYHARNFSNSVENWRMYSGKNPDAGLGQYDSRTVTDLLQQGRQIVTYNMIMPTIDVITAMLIQNTYDPEFLPVEEDATELTEALKHVFYSDKEVMDWELSFFELIKHGLIHEGVLKMVVSDKVHKLGNIGFEVCLPGSVYSDPSWKTRRSKDCKICWKESYLTAEELARLYPDKIDLIKPYIDRDNQVGKEYGNNTSVLPYFNAGEKWGSSFRVLEQYEVLPMEKKVEYVITEAFGRIDLPETDDIEMKKAWMDAHIPESEDGSKGWSAEHVFEEEITEDACTVKSACQLLSREVLLEDGLTEVQVGRLPFFFWSASRDNGEIHSVVDSVKDVQRNMNYMAMMIIHKIQSEGAGGSHFYDNTLFYDDAEARRFTKYRNKPNENFRTKDGVLSRGIEPSRPVAKSQFPQELYQHFNLLMDKVWVHVSKVTPSTFARPEPGNETSGRLFSLLKGASDNLVFTLNYGLKLFMNDLYEAYLLQAAKTYSNEMYPRSFNHGGTKVTINEPMYDEATGQIKVKNDFSQLLDMRHKVIISETNDSPSQKMYNLSILTEYLSRVLPTQTATAVVVNTSIAENIDQFDDETKGKLKVAGNMEVEVALGELELRLLNQKVQKQQMMQALGGQLPAEGQPPVAEGMLPDNEAPQGQAMEMPEQAGQAGVLPSQAGVMPPPPSQ